MARVRDTLATREKKAKKVGTRTGRAARPLDLRTNMTEVTLVNNGIDLKVTAATKARYNRIARIYDRMETLSENRFKPWREKLWGSPREISSKSAWARARISRFIRLTRR